MRQSGQISCECGNQFRGQFCEDRVQESLKNGQKLDEMTIVVALLIFVIVLLAILVAFVLVYHFKNRVTSEAKKPMVRNYINCILIASGYFLD